MFDEAIIFIFLEYSKIWILYYSLIGFLILHYFIFSKIIPQVFSKF